LEAEHAQIGLKKSEDVFKRILFWIP